MIMDDPWLQYKIHEEQSGLRKAKGVRPDPLTIATLYGVSVADFLDKLDETLDKKGGETC
jgi:hypothetical protein